MNLQFRVIDTTTGKEFDSQAQAERCRHMTTKRVGRIYNPVTRKYYSVRRKTTSGGKAGQIRGLWSRLKEVGGVSSDV